MRGSACALLALSTIGCNALLGISDLHQSTTHDDAPLGAIDAATIDAPPGGAPKLEIDADMYMFGTVVTGGAPVDHTFKISNTGTAPTGSVHAEITGAATSSFSIGSTDCTTVTAGGMCSVTVRFSPADAAGLTATLHVSASPGGDLMTTLSGTGLAPGSLIVTPNTSSFGSIVLGGASTPPASLTVKNTGGADSGVIDVQLTGTDANQWTFEPNVAGDCKGAHLGMNETCKVRLHFAPTSEGGKSASIVVSSASAGGTTASIDGTGQNALTASPALHDFNTLGTSDSSAAFAFSVTNGTSTQTGPILLALAGADNDQFAIDAPIAGDCVHGVTKLTMGASCAVHVRFKPTSTGAKSASLTFNASPGGSASATATGTAVLPANLAVTGGPLAFGMAGTGSTTSTMSCTVKNTGEAQSGALSIVLGGANADQFVIATPSGGDCVNGTTKLAMNAQCTVQIAFKPTSLGSKSANVTITGAPGGGGGCGLTGTGANPAVLTPTTTTKPFGNVALNQASGSTTWTLTNTGGVATGVLFKSTSGDTADFSIVDGAKPCANTVAGGDTCSMQISFTPKSFGSKTLTVTLTASPGGTVTFTGTGSVTGGLTVTKTGGGTGTIVSTPAGISCLSGCSTQTAQFAGLSSVMLEAKGLPGSYFQGWSGACTGTYRFCNVNIDNASQTATANFAPNTFNLVFATSKKYPANFGGLGFADNECKNLAAAAGLPGTYVAWLSTASTNAKDRLGTASGWVRLDGEPVAQAIGPLTTLHALLHQIQYDENGQSLTLFDDGVWTGADPDGLNTGGTCQDWSSAAHADSTWFGYAGGGPLSWTRTNPTQCDAGPYRLYCFQTDKTASITIPVTAGKKIWISTNSFLANFTVATANNECDTHRPPGVTKGIALLGTSAAAASTLVGATTNYIRPDGVFVGTGDDLAQVSSNLKPLRAGIWQQGDGVYVTSPGDSGAWTGGVTNGSFTQKAATSQDCSDWTSVSALVRGGYSIFQYTSSAFWNFGSYACNDGLQFRVYCVEP